LPHEEDSVSTNVILLVEDNPDDVALTIRAFDRCGIANKLDVVCDGAKALDYLLCRGEYADRDQNEGLALVLLDLKLPKVDGLEVLRCLRADSRTKLLPVVILTSSREEEDVMKGYCLGANSFVRKPVDFLEFVEAVRQLGLYWLIINQPPPKPSRRGVE
jgi:two-component system, response regulator